MDFLDVNPIITVINPIPSRLYIVTTVCYGVAFLVNLLFALKRRLWYPHLLIGFILANGIIMRGITLGTLGKTHENGSLFASYDYPRILFATFSLLGFYLLPIFTIQYYYRLKSQKSSSSPSSSSLPLLDKSLLFGSYFFSMLILIFMICFLVKGSTLLLPPFRPPQNMQYTTVPVNGDTFIALLHTYYMLFWWFPLTNLVILFKYFTPLIRWPFMIYCGFTIIYQVILTIITFLPVLRASIGGYATTMILQFVFLFQFPFIAIMITIIKSDSLLHSDHQDVQNDNAKDTTNNMEM